MAVLNVIRAAAGAALLAAVAGGCEFIHPPTYVPGDPGQLLVHAVLTAGSDSAAVIVARVGTGFEEEPVLDAVVRLAGPDGQVTLPGAPLAACTGGVPHPDATPMADRGCYAAALPAPVRSGAEYRLEVDVPAGERVRGSTTVPPAPGGLVPAEGTRFPGGQPVWQVMVSQPFTVRWTAAGPVSLNGWVNRVWSPEPALNCSGTASRVDNYFTGTVVDSVRVVLEVAGCSAGPDKPAVQPDSVEMMISVTAYDSAYVQYLAGSEDGIPAEQARGNLEGAYGVFGSAARAGRRLRVIRQ